VKEVKTYCRLCSGKCGLVVTLGDDGALLKARGDHDHAMSQGYACIKGIESPAIHNAPERLLRPLRRTARGDFEEIPLAIALDEIAGRLGEIIAAGGPRAVALFRGTPNYANAAASYMVRYFLKAIGSPCFFSTMTIDQSAKWVTDERLGTWAAGRQRFETSDVFLAFGYNPLLSVQGGYGFYVNNPTKQMREAKARGLRLIVVDPRRTETAHFADIHLQPLPGEDATIAAAMLRLILDRGLEDRTFCARWAPGLSDLRRAVDPFTVAEAARRAEVPEAALVAATEMFAAGPRGIAMTGTGPDMATRSNLANHLIECLNVVCGRFAREGEAVRNTGVLEPPPRPGAEARAPRRAYQGGHRTRVRGLGRLNGEMMTPALPEEILTPGEGRIRALFCVAGNPAAVFPDQRRTVEALKALDLLVSLEPTMTGTARLSHYVLPPKLMFERPDGPQIWETVAYPVPFAQYTPAIVEPPAGSEVVDEWYPFWAIAGRLGLPITFCGQPLDMQTPPTSDGLLDLIAKDAQLPLDEVRQRPGGVLYESGPATVVEPPRADATGRFDVAPPDVQAEIAELAADRGVADPAFPLRLAVRRTREVMNSAYRDVPAIRARVPYNPARLNPDDLADLGLADGERAEITSAHGAVEAVVTADPTLRRGVVTLSHGFGGLPGESSYERDGANTNLLTSLERDVQPINGMARFSAIPVRVRPANRPPR
jgi:anaerobic selenocysteine-containing dehydrogenase